MKAWRISPSGGIKPRTSDPSRQRMKLQEENLLRSLVLVGALLLGVNTASAQQPAADPQNTVVLTTKDGAVTIRLRPDLAPKHVAQIKALTKRGFYNGVVFHRVMPGFMAQTGDPTGTGTGGSDLPNIPAEFSRENFKRGTVGMARAQSPELGELPVLHYVRGRPIPRWQVHHCWKCRVRHGRR